MAARGLEWPSRRAIKSDVLDAPGENDPPGHVIRRRIGAHRSHLGGGPCGAQGVAVGEPQLRDQVWRAVSVGKADGEALETGDCLHERHVPLAVGSLEVVAVGGVEVLDGDLVHRSSISSLAGHPYPRHFRELMWFRARRPQGRGTTGPAPGNEHTEVL